MEEQLKTTAQRATSGINVVTCPICESAKMKMGGISFVPLSLDDLAYIKVHGAKTLTVKCRRFSLFGGQHRFRVRLCR